jgi:hypothetical protein
MRSLSWRRILYIVTFVLFALAIVFWILTFVGWFITQPGFEPLNVLAGAIVSSLAYSIAGGPASPPASAHPNRRWVASISASSRLGAAMMTTGGMAEIAALSRSLGPAV